MSGKKTHVLSVFMNREYPCIVKGEGIYLYDDRGKRYIDSAGGPILCNLGHGVKEMADALGEQARKAAFVYRMDFTNQPLEDATRKVSEATGGAMDKVFMVSGGSEANEIAVKIARTFHMENGEPSRFKVISRWLSYHGMTNGALSWSGMTSRRARYVPMLKDDSHIAPAYCYRCWFKQSPETCDLACADALENEILCQGPETVAVFIAEPLSGMSLCAAHPRAEYFQRVREICDKYGVLLILDEVMTGFGRTGKWFAFEHFGIIPDILTLGKGLGGGYFPVGAAAVTARLFDTIANRSGIFGAGFSWAGNPMAAAVVSKAIDILRERDLVARSAKMGEYLAGKMEGLRSHPTVGDIRGKGLMRGIEFVKDKRTKEPLDPQLTFYNQLSHEALSRGLFIESSGGCDRGRAGDMVMFGPPFIITEAQIDEMVGLFDETLSAVEKRIGF
jgi:adenosylmethionine-8-amino-7-oxononanoate aminotransferase